MTSKRPTRLDYCQYLLVSQIDYTITNYADHKQNEMSHDAINRYLRDDRLTSRLVWENVRSQIQTSPPWLRRL
jgi:type III secretory pathway component EscU